MKRVLLIFTLLCGSALAQNLGAFNGICGVPGQAVITQGLPSVGTASFYLGSSPGSTLLNSGTLGVYPECTVYVYLTGTNTLASIYANNLSSPTAKANPFTANTDGSFLFYAASQTGYDIVMSSSSFISLPNSFTLTDVVLCNQNCGASGGQVTLETNGTQNLSQTLLNFLNANGCSWSNPSGGEETISCSSSGVTGSGTAGTLPAWLSGGTSLGNSLLSETGSGYNGNLNFNGAYLNFTAIDGDGSGNSIITCTGANCYDIWIFAPTTSSKPGAYIKAYTWADNNGQLALGSGGTATHGYELDINNNGTFTWVSYPQTTFSTLSGSGAGIGSEVYCIDCHTQTTPCSTSGGTGSGTFAFQINGTWECPF